MSNDEFICPISGQTAEAPDDGGPPVGWVVITVQRRVPNAEYLNMQRAQQEEFAATMQTIPEDRRPAYSDIVLAQITCRWYAYEKSLPPYVTEISEVTLAPGELSEDVREFLGAVYETTGMDALAELPLAPIADDDFPDIDEKGEPDDDGAAQGTAE